MTGCRRPALFLAALLAPHAAVAQSADVDPVSLATAVGQAILIMLGVVAGLSVLAKLAIVFGVVPREPQNRSQALVHTAANIVGRLRPARPLRDQRRAGRPGDRGRR